MGMGYRLSRRRHRIIYDRDRIFSVSEPGRKFLMGPGAPLQARPIDMGLPSGLQWASCNIGAERLVDVGLFFSWGNIEGHMVDEGYNFSQNEYESTPGAVVDTNLPLEQDAARAILGEPWRMPSDTEFQELYDNCTSVWTTMNGVFGNLFTSNVNGNKLFLPAAGFYSGTSLNLRGSLGYYWSSTFFSSAAARVFNFTDSDSGHLVNVGRRVGIPVRAVMELL